MCNMVPNAPVSVSRFMLFVPVSQTETVSGMEKELYRVKYVRKAMINLMTRYNRFCLVQIDLRAYIHILQLIQQIFS